MQLANQFAVPLPPDEAWKTLLDRPRMARCEPGAVLTETVDSSTYKGNVSITIGPDRTAQLKVQGSDTQRRGAANAAAAHNALGIRLHC
jgi:carbon monoxide dehydrogenase subunit G